MQKNNPIRNSCLIVACCGTGCVQVNSPLFPGPVAPMVIERACPQVMASIPLEAQSAPPMVAVPKLTPPIPMDPVPNATPMEPIP